MAAPSLRAKIKKFLRVVLEKNSGQMDEGTNGQTHGGYFIGPSFRGSKNIF